MCKGTLLYTTTALKPGPSSLQSLKTTLGAQALSLGYAVCMQGAMPGCTPAIITPPFVSPAGDDEPGATPMNDATPQVVTMYTRTCMAFMSYVHFCHTLPHQSHEIYA